MNWKDTSSDMSLPLREAGLEEMLWEVWLNCLVSSGLKALLMNLIM